MTHSSLGGRLGYTLLWRCTSCMLSHMKVNTHHISSVCVCVCLVCVSSTMQCDSVNVRVHVRVYSAPLLTHLMYICLYVCACVSDLLCVEQQDVRGHEVHETLSRSSLGGDCYSYTHCTCPTQALLNVASLPQFPEHPLQPCALDLITHTLEWDFSDHRLTEGKARPNWFEVAASILSAPC